MRSYASIDRIEGRYAVCEVELLEKSESDNVDFLDRETEMVDIPLELIEGITGKVKEGDVILVEHEGEVVTSVYGKADEEKQKRIEIIKKIVRGE